VPEPNGLVVAPRPNGKKPDASGISPTNWSPRQSSYRTGTGAAADHQIAAMDTPWRCRCPVVGGAHRNEQVGHGEHEP
jgi:hypothetical protein